MPAGGKTSGSFKSSVVDGKKACPYCKEWKLLEDFGFRKTQGKTYPESRCRACRNIITAEWAKKNREKRNQYHDNWKKENPGRVEALSRDWRLNNIERSRNNSNSYTKRRKLVDPEFKLRYVVRGRFSSALRRKGKKSLATLELIGCSIHELRLHLESLFEPWMTWENHGSFGWVIDHKIPCSSFRLSDPEEQKKCFHWSNLQPLHWKANLTKSDKIIDFPAQVGKSCLA